MHETIVVGYWMSEKKRKKLSFNELTKFCRLHNIKLVQIDLDRDISIQGPFDAILHKLSDICISAERDGNATATRQWNNIQTYVNNHPEVVVIDPFRSMRQLCDRFLQYSLMKATCTLTDCRVTCPDFVILNSNNVEENAKSLENANITFPIVCKPLQAHGSQYAHQMMLVFCKNGLHDIQSPCIAQTFVRHNALLHKLYVIGDFHCLMIRPSLKNFTASDSETIFFDSQKVSKDGCNSELTKLNETDLEEKDASEMVNEEDVVRLIEAVRLTTKLSNFGMDLIVEKDDQKRLMVIDVNCFPDISCLCCQKRIVNGEICRCSSTETTSQQAPLFFTYVVDMIKQKLLEQPFLGNNNNKRPPSFRRRNSHHQMINRLAIADSGIGSATSSESEESSDTELVAKRLEIRAARINSGGAPDWTRIKRFYGIPKPLWPCPGPPRSRPDVIPFRFSKQSVPRAAIFVVDPDENGAETIP